MMPGSMGSFAPNIIFYKKNGKFKICRPFPYRFIKFSYENQNLKSQYVYTVMISYYLLTESFILQKNLCSS